MGTGIDPGDRMRREELNDNQSGVYIRESLFQFWSVFKELGGGLNHGSKKIGVSKYFLKGYFLKTHQDKSWCYWPVLLCFHVYFFQEQLKYKPIWIRLVNSLVKLGVSRVRKQYHTRQLWVKVCMTGRSLGPWNFGWMQIWRKGCLGGCWWVLELR